MKTSYLLAFGVVIGIYSQINYAGSVTDTFTTGDTLTATTLNNIKSAVNDNDTQISAMKTGFVSVSAVAASHNEITDTSAWSCGSMGCLRSTSARTSPISLTIPVQLPHGASIISFSYTVYDTDPTQNTTAQLFRNIDGFVPIASASSSGSAGLETITTGVAANTIIDNSASGYYVIMSTWNNLPSGLVNGLHATIEYTLP